MHETEATATVRQQDAAAAGVRCAALPSWVRHEPWPATQGSAADACTDNGILRLLYDAQTSLTQPGVSCCVRSVQRILTRRGAEGASRVSVEFDPLYEQLLIHHVRIWRGQDQVEHARSEAVQVLRREAQLERLALNGRLTATLLIPDLRVDDQLETSFTLVSVNQAFLGRYVGWMIFNGFAPWVETRQRLVGPPGRRVGLKAFNDPPPAVVSAPADVEESRWALTGQPRLAVEPLLPSWIVKNPCYQVSEFSDWSEVVHLFVAHYRDDAVPQEIAAELDRLRQSYPDPADQAVEWLRYVQSELRYFALNLGEGGWVPRPLEDIWTGRFGDCKDAARLYVAGACRLGLDACAALVSTTHGLSLEEFLPSPGVFNHVIVRLRLGSTTYWLDPTLQRQGGSLHHVFQPHAGWALPLVAESAGLERLPETEPLEHVRCEDSIELGPRPESPGTLRRRYDFRYWAADAIRHRLEDEGDSKLSAQILQDLCSTWPGVAEIEKVSVTDDPVTNQVSMSFGYQLRDCWKEDVKSGRLMLELVDGVLTKELAPLDAAPRTFPVSLGRPRRASWRATVQLPCRWRGEGWHQAIREPELFYSTVLQFNRRQVVLERQLLVSAWSMSAGRADAYAAAVAKLRQNKATLFARVRFGRIRPPGRLPRVARVLLRILIFFVVWLVLVTLNHLLDHPLVTTQP